MTENKTDPTPMISTHYSSSALDDAEERAAKIYEELNPISEKPADPLKPGQIREPGTGKIITIGQFKTATQEEAEEIFAREKGSRRDID